MVMYTLFLTMITIISMSLLHHATTLNLFRFCATSFHLGNNLNYHHRHDSSCNPRSRQQQQTRPRNSNTYYLPLYLPHYQYISNVNHRLQLSSLRKQLRTMSVSGVIYDTYDDEMKWNNSNNKDNASSAAVVTLFTKEGCTLCDKVQAVLSELRTRYPHKLVAVDITDPTYHDVWYEKYKYDIPVLHVNDVYWAKHRITTEQAEQCLYMVLHQEAPITPIGTEPNAVNSRPKMN